MDKLQVKECPTTYDLNEFLATIEPSQVISVNYFSDNDGDSSCSFWWVLFRGPGHE